jgi:hypothetical protein
MNSDILKTKRVLPQKPVGYISKKAVFQKLDRVKHLPLKLSPHLLLLLIKYGFIWFVNFRFPRMVIYSIYSRIIIKNPLK